MSVICLGCDDKKMVLGISNNVLRSERKEGFAAVAAAAPLLLSDSSRTIGAKLQREGHDACS